MSYAQGTLIEATDYYTLAAAGGAYTGPYVGQQWGVGFRERGLGQSIGAISSIPNNISAGNQITATQWSGLINTVNSCLSHQGKTPITPGSVTTGTQIAYLAAIATGSSLAYTSAGLTGYALSDSVANTATRSGAWGTTGLRDVVSIHTVTFASGDAARYFFNAGGKIKITTARTGGSNTVRNAEWTTLCSSIGSVQIGYKNTTQVGASGASAIRNTDNGGYWNLQDGYQRNFRQIYGGGGGSYYYSTTDYIQIDCMWSGTEVNGGKPTLLIKTIFSNDAVLPGSDAVDGNISASLVVSSPATTVLSNTWGNPSVSNSINAV